MRKCLWSLLTLGLAAILLVACSREGPTHVAGGSRVPQGHPASSGGKGAIVEVHTNTSNFVKPEVTVPKGGSLKLVNDANVLHIISLGVWNNGNPKNEQEAGAPNVHNQQLTSSSSITIGPWNTPGTYHLYCTVHPNMELTVKVS